MAKKNIINSWEDLQKNVTSITRLLNKDQNLLIAAASNPILALNELGYTIQADILGHIEDKMRFKTQQVVKLKNLRSIILKTAKKYFNIRSKDQLEQVLFEDLQLEVYHENGCPISKSIEPFQKGACSDSLEPYSGLHPIIEPLLAFRQIDASVFSFCDIHTYQKIRTGKYGKGSSLQLKIQLKKNKI
jgi:DNA polymerase I-like protein with 3'-5' exonuclease and polymerase domains